MKAILISLFIAMIMWQIPSQAKVNEKLQSYFQNEIQKMAASISNEDSNSAVSADLGADNEMWFLNRFRLYFRASGGFEIDGLTQFLVQPEVELLFMRYPAPGWANYHP